MLIPFLAHRKNKTVSILSAALVKEERKLANSERAFLKSFC